MNKFSFVTIIINNDVNEHSKHLESTNEPPFFFFFLIKKKKNQRVKNGASPNKTSG